MHMKMLGSCVMNTIMQHQNANFSYEVVSMSLILSLSMSSGYSTIQLQLCVTCQWFCLQQPFPPTFWGQT